MKSRRFFRVLRRPEYWSVFVGPFRINSNPYSASVKFGKIAMGVEWRASRFAYVVNHRYKDGYFLWMAVVGNFCIGLTYSPHPARCSLI